MIGINELKALLKSYENLLDEEKRIKKEKENIRKIVGEFMHEQKTNEVKIKYSDQDYWSCKYQKRTTETVNKDLLYDSLGEDEYQKFVDVKTSYSINIRKMKNNVPKKPPTDIRKKIDKIETPTGTVE